MELRILSEYPRTREGRIAALHLRVYVYRIIIIIIIIWLSLSVSGKVYAGKYYESENCTRTSPKIPPRYRVQYFVLIIWITIKCFRCPSFFFCKISPENSVNNFFSSFSRYALSAVHFTRSQFSRHSTFASVHVPARNFPSYKLRRTSSSPEWSLYVRIHSCTTSYYSSHSQFCK